MKLCISVARLLLIVAIVMHVTIVALSFNLLLASGAAYGSNQSSRYDAFWAFASANIQSDATVAFVTSGTDDYLWDYYRVSYALYPRAVWWVRPTPCRQAITWCVQSPLSAVELGKVFAQLGARYAIVGNLPDLEVSAADRIAFDQQLFILKLR